MIPVTEFEVSSVMRHSGHKISNRRKLNEAHALLPISLKNSIDSPTSLARLGENNSKLSLKKR